MITDTLVHLFIFSGLSFAFSLINSVVGLQKNAEKTYLFFGIISFFVGMYYLLFPFINDDGGSSAIATIALIFFISAFGFFPWFIKAYTSINNKIIPWVLSIGMGIVMMLFLFQGENQTAPWWNIFAHLVLLGIIAFGFMATKTQFKRGEKKSAIYLIAALIPFFLLTIDDIIYIHFNQFYLFDLPERILPFDYFFIFFMIIMGIKLAMDMHQKYQLEKSIITKEKRWGNLLEKVQLLVISIDRRGIINYVNPYFLKLTGFQKEEIIGNHYINIIPENNRDALQDLANSIDAPSDLPYYQNNIVTKSGDEKTIAWSLVRNYNESGDFISSISIGSDTTKRQKAYEEIILLKSRLEEENMVLKVELDKVREVGEIKGKSDAILYVLQRAKQVAPTNATVLLEGETGVGKELVANYIQQKSNRADKPFIKINCAAIPSNLLESELFGHLKGAFTGADKNKKGLVELADGGTLFLDEIGDFPYDLQAKLLRFLQEGEYLPLGSEATRKADVRIIAATNHGLLEMIEKKQFRNDLYYRLYVYPITLPALRNRMDDIPEFVTHFANQYSKIHNKPIKKVSHLVIEKLKEYDWPGNIRELENIIERAVIVSGSDTIKLKDFNLFWTEKLNDPNTPPGQFDTLKTLERNHIIAVLMHCNWQVHGPKGAAQILGINPNTLRSRMKKLNIIRP